MRICDNCLWEGEDIKVNDLGHCPNCGDTTRQTSVDVVDVPEEKPEPQTRKLKKKNNFDFNKDGKVDEEDFSLAAKALASRRKKR